MERINKEHEHHWFPFGFTSDPNEPDVYWVIFGCRGEDGRLEMDWQYLEKFEV